MKHAAATVAHGCGRIAIESLRIWRKSLRVSAHRHSARPYPEGFRLPKWEWQKPKQSVQKL